MSDAPGRTIEELEGQLDAIAVCIRSKGLPVFLQSAWPDLPDILTDSATQLRRLRKMFEEDAPLKRGKHTNTSDGYCEICRPAKR